MRGFFEELFNWPSKLFSLAIARVNAFLCSIRFCGYAVPPVPLTVIAASSAGTAVTVCCAPEVMIGGAIVRVAGPVVAPESAS